MAGPTPTTEYTTPGPGNVYVPGATNRVVEYTRDPASFPFSQYVEIAPTDKESGLYKEINPTDAVTVVSLADYHWPDGQPRPIGAPIPHRWLNFDAKRYNFPFRLGNLSVDQADDDIVASNARGMAAKAMTHRTLEAMTAGTASGNWGSNTAATVGPALGGAAAGTTWYGADTTTRVIKESFALVAIAIQKATGGAVSGTQLGVIINPTTARKMALTGEINAYLTQHEQAMSNLQGNDPQNLLNIYGMPPMLYGVRIVVEDAVRQTTRRDEDASGTVSYCLADDKAIFFTMDPVTAQPSGININPNAATQSYSTFTMFTKEEMTVETKIEEWDRLTEGAVVDHRDIKIAAPASGYLIQDVGTSG
jgi:hypothetical protein